MFAANRKTINQGVKLSLRILYVGNVQKAGSL